MKYKADAEAFEIPVIGRHSFVVFVHENAYDDTDDMNKIIKLIESNTPSLEYGGDMVVQVDGVLPQCRHH